METVGWPTLTLTCFDLLHYLLTGSDKLGLSPDASLYADGTHPERQDVALAQGEVREAAHRRAGFVAGRVHGGREARPWARSTGVGTSNSISTVARDSIQHDATWLP